MGTAVGMRAADGVALAADRRVLEGDVIRSDDVDHLFTMDEVVVASVGPPGGVQRFHRVLEADLRRYRLRHDRRVHIDVFRRLVSDVVEGTNTASILAAADEDGRAALVQVDASGGTSDDPRVAIGDGATVALGLIDALDPDHPTGEIVEELEALLNSAAERSTAIGPRIDSAIVVDDPA